MGSECDLVGSDLGLGLGDPGLIFVGILGDGETSSVVRCGIEWCFFLFNGFVKGCFVCWWERGAE